MPYTIHRLVWLPEVSEAISSHGGCHIWELGSTRRVSVTLEGGRILSEEGRNSVRVWSERVRVRVNKGESLEFPSSSLLFLFVLDFWGLAASALSKSST